MEYSLNEVMMSEMAKYTTNVLKEAVKMLSKEYGFKAEEALAKMKIEEMKVTKSEKKKTEEPKMPLPFTGEIKEEWCGAMKQNHGLYSQCTSKKMAEGELCKACKNQEEKKGQPTHGYIRDRLKGELMEYKDAKGKKVVSYGIVMKKLNITQADAEEEAKKFGMTIPADQFEISEKARGRPKSPKDETESDADKKRGRPKKEKKMVSANAADDLIATLVAQAQQLKITTAKPVDEEHSTSELEEEEEEEEQEQAKALAEKELEKEKEQAKALAEKELEKATKKAQQEQEKKEKAEQVKAAKKAQQEEEKANKKAQQEQEKAEKKALQEEEKKAKKAQQEQEKKDKKGKGKAVVEPTKENSKELTEEPIGDEEVSPTKEPAGDEEVSPTKEEASISVKKFEFEGKLYLRSEDDVMYDIKTQEPVGMWNEEEKCIDEIEIEDD
jgi:hypothetical protein